MNEELNFLRNVPIFFRVERFRPRKDRKTGARKKYKKGNIIVLEKELGAACLSSSREKSRSFGPMKTAGR